MQANVLEVKHDCHYNHMVTQNENAYMRRIIWELVLSAGNWDPTLVHRLMPEGTPPILTNFLSRTEFQIIPTKEEKSTNSNCQNSKVFSHGKWIHRTPNSKTNCVTWDKTIPVNIFSNSISLESTVVEGDHVPSASDDAQAWDYFAQHVKEIEEMETIYSYGGVAGTGLGEILALG